MHFTELLFNQGGTSSPRNWELCDELCIVVGRHNWARLPVKAPGEAGCENTMCESQVDLKCETEL